MAARLALAREAELDLVEAYAIRRQPGMYAAVHEIYRCCPVQI
jgi:hypothetical protein